MSHNGFILTNLQMWQENNSIFTMQSYLKFTLYWKAWMRLCETSSSSRFSRSSSSPPDKMKICFFSHEKTKIEALVGCIDTKDNLWVRKSIRKLKDNTINLLILSKNTSRHYLLLFSSCDKFRAEFKRVYLSYRQL